MGETNGPFPSSKTVTFKARLSVNLSCENEFYLNENKKSFPCQSPRTYPRFKTEARGNWEFVFFFSRVYYTNIC